MKLRLLAFFLSLSAVTSCKTTEVSKGKSVVFERRGFTYLFHFDNGQFVFQKCNTDKLTAVDKTSTAALKAACNEFTSIIPTTTLASTIKSAIEAPNLQLLSSLRDIDVAKTEKEFEEANMSLAETSDLISILFPPGSAPDPMKDELIAKEAKLQQVVKDLITKISERKALPKEALATESLLEIAKAYGDVAKASQNFSLAFITMIRDAKVYQLNFEKHTVLVDALEKLEPKCKTGTGVSEEITEIIGFEEVTYKCIDGKTLEAKGSKCRPGYERVDRVCRFSGAGLSDFFVDLVYYNEQVCGHNKAGKVICSPYRSTFYEREVCNLNPEGMVDCSTVKQMEGQLSQELNDFGAKQLSSDQNSLCSLNAEGKLRCWFASPSLAIPYDAAKTYSAVSVFRDSICAIEKSTGNALCSGNSNTSANIPTTQKFSEIGVSDGWACGITQDASPSCWGGYLPDRVPPVIEKSKWKNLKIGAFRGCAQWFNLEAVIVPYGWMRCFGDMSDVGDLPTTVLARDFAMGYSFICYSNDKRDVLCQGLDSPKVPTGIKADKIISDHQAAQCALDQEKGTIRCFSDLLL